jgi:hypothetical protein
MVAAREDRESFLARLGLSLADTARLLGVSTPEMVSGTFFRIFDGGAVREAQPGKHDRPPRRLRGIVRIGPG